MPIFQGKHLTATAPNHRGFTLIELLVVISIIGLLIALLLPVLGIARDTAAQSARLSDMRQMMIGYTANYTDNKDRLIYGKLPFIGDVDGTPSTIRVAGHEFGSIIAQRYPWRIAPYISGVWDILHSHQQTPEAPKEGEPFADAFDKAYNISIEPGFGLNTIYVGGDLAGQGFVRVGTNFPPSYTPNRGQHVVFQASEVLRPSELLVFTDSKSDLPPPPGTEPRAGDVGNYFSTPPRLRGEQQWRANGSEMENLKPGTNIGLPEGYVADGTTTGFFDGSARTVSYEELSDMRLWANKADSADYDYTTQ
ncbi:MAG: prepilin-type N-terminal cleavage/methylation domain-containing protein [Planctomycetota bacterium]